MTPARHGAALAIVAAGLIALGTYPVDLRATPTLTGVRLRLAVTNPSSRAIVRRFAIVHERPMHLFVVGDGLRFFAHEHPVQQRDGVFMLDLALPRPGPYMAIAEFLPEGGTPQVFQQVFTTGAPVDSAPPPAVDLESKVVDGLRVSVDVSKLRSGAESALAFRVEDAQSGAEADLEPYLGATAHVFIVSADLTETTYAHTEDKPSALSFKPLLPTPGVYKMWLQIQHRGHVSTVPFVAQVAGT